MQKFQVFESAIADLHRIFYPHAAVTWNKKVVGKSGVERQIDVFIEDNSGVYPIKIVVDCKLHTSKLDINDIETAWMLMDDIRANLGIIVCNSGYTQNAIQRAKDIGLLKLCLAVIPEQKEFSATLFMPMIAQKVDVKSIVEIHPKSLVPIVSELGLEKIVLENIKASKKRTLYDLVLEHLDTSRMSFSNETTIEILDKEHELYLKQEFHKFFKIIVRCAYTSKLVVGYSPVKNGRGIFEVSDKNTWQGLCSFSQEQTFCNFLLGSELRTDYSIEELKDWNWRDFDLEKDFSLYIRTDFEEINTFFEVEQYFL
jgi:hypothetical protein